MNINPDQHKAASSHWVLIVDDEKSMCDMISNMLAEEKVEIVTAGDGATALRLVEKRGTEPLLVVVDVLMPGMDGLTLARKLSARLTRSKIIMMSGHLSDDSWWPADLREITFLTKPFRMAELTELVDAARAEARAESRDKP